MSVEVKKDIDGLINLSRALEFARKNSVYVGISVDTNQRPEQEGIRSLLQMQNFFLYTQMDPQLITYLRDQ